MGIDATSLIVFAACLILFVWDRLPMATTAILGCVAMVILAYATSRRPSANSPQARLS